MAETANAQQSKSLRHKSRRQGRERATYRLAEELGGLETLSASYHQQNFGRHSHEGFTLGIIDSGAQRFFRSGGDHVAPKHSIILVNADEVHNLVNADEVHNGRSATENGWSYRALYPTPEQFAELALCSKQQVPWFAEPVVQDPLLAHLIAITHEALNYSSNRLQRESLLYETLSLLMLRHGRLKPAAAVQAGPLLNRARQFLEDSCSSNISLQELANLVQLPPFVLLRQFRAQFGSIPFRMEGNSLSENEKTGRQVRAMEGISG
ncbi:AraC family ligand binding domain-containing protein [Shewanella algae]|uniref:AraC family ligand binding domain-containing protein n=1 Tax=Shewanella algae TaxID=38313 RepID=UPI0015E81BAB|nr:AraC family ligand binding domain-containing protein [Shewanella algae]